jgi:predicted permease
MDSLVQDIRYAVRMLLQKPGFTLLAVATLAIGIGASAAIFSVLDSFILQPLPGARDNSNLETVGYTRPDLGGFVGQLSYPDFLDYRDNSSNVFDGMAGYVNAQVGMTADGRSDIAIAHYVTSNLFDLLGLQPALGRFFLPGEGDRAANAPIIVLGYNYWQDRFGADLNIVGKSVEVNGKPVTIIGVAPKKFHGPFVIVDTSFYIPIGMSAALGGEDLYAQRGSHDLTAFAQPKPGVSREQARAALQVVAQHLDHQYPITDHDTRIVINSERLSRPDPGSASGNVLVVAIFLSLVALALFVTCVNVANLVLVRATGRARELAVRASLGAGRLRLVRQMLTESVLLTLLGGIAGGLFGAFLASLVAQIQVPGGITIYWHFAFDWRVYLSIGAVVVFCAFLVGVIPAFRASRLDLNTTLREGGRSDSGSSSRNRLRSAMVVAQVAGSLVVLVAAGLFIRSLQAAQKLDLGFRPDHVLNVSVDPGLVGYSQARSEDFLRNLKDRVLALPGAQNAAYAYSVPMGYDHDGARVWRENQPTTERGLISAELNRVDEDFFRTMGISIIRGRGFTAADTKDSVAVAIINEHMANQLWPGQDPIGHHFRYGYGRNSQTTVEVVGLTPTGKYDEVFEDPSDYFYLPYSQNYSTQHVLQVRTTAAPESLAQPIQSLAREIDPAVPVYNVITMEESLQGGNGFFLVKIGALFAGTIGVLCLLLAVIGVYGVISYAAGLRTHEIGVRMALGAQRTEILQMVLRQGLLLVGLGLAIGLGLSFGFTRFMRNMLVGVGAFDPLTFAAVSLVLVSVAAIACFVPARRATKVDPLVALRYE